jgi:hypothetical protein
MITLCQEEAVAGCRARTGAKRRTVKASELGGKEGRRYAKVFETVSSSVSDWILS